MILGQIVRFGESACVDTYFEARDSRGKSCVSGNYDSGNICGLYDDVDFTANQMCCGCGGGFTWDRGEFDEEWDASAPYCYDDTGNGQLNAFGTGNTCAYYVITRAFRMLIVKEEIRCSDTLHCLLH